MFAFDGLAHAENFGGFGYIETSKPVRSSSVRRTSKKSSQGKRSARSGRSSRGGLCSSIRPTVASIVGEGQADCYLRLFQMETSCRYNLPQAKGNAGNPHAAYGICSLEASPAIRARNGRGANCRDISTLANQVKCCQSIMRKTPHYFGPVLHHKVARCH